MAPLAGLAAGTANGATVLYGYGASGWTALSGGEVTTNAPVAWKALLDFGSGTVAYTLGSVAFSPKTALPLGATHAERVVFRGKGEFGAFRGIYAEPGVAYYFDNESSLPTIYQEKPFNFNLNMGLRFNLGK